MPSPGANSGLVKEGVLLCPKVSIAVATSDCSSVVVQESFKGRLRARSSQRVSALHLREAFERYTAWPARIAKNASILFSGAPHSFQRNRNCTGDDQQSAGSLRPGHAFT